MTKLVNILKSSLAGFALITAGCVPVFESETKKILQEEYNMTEPQATVCVVQAVRDKLGREIKKKDKIFYKPNYMSISVDVKLKHILKQRASLKNFLENEDEGLIDFLDNINSEVRPRLEKEQKILDIVASRYIYMVNYGKFMKLVGGNSIKNNLPKNLQSMNLDERYDKDGNLNFDGLEIRNPFIKLDEQFPFIVEYVETAKKEEWIKPGPSAKFFDSTRVEKKNPDENSDEDKIWVDQIRNVEVLCFETDEAPDDAVDIDYIEVYVLDKNGKRESKPAIRVFENDSGDLEVILADFDREGEKGFGLPDYVKKVWGLDTDSSAAKSFYRNQAGLISKLFLKSEEKEFKKKKIKKTREMQEPIFLQTGDAYMPEYEICDNPEGWSLPRSLVKYVKEDYDLFIQFKKNKKDKLHNQVNPHNPHDKKEKNNQGKVIEYIAKVFEGKGRVVEFYKVKPEYSTDVLKVTFDYSTDLVKFLVKGKSAKEQRDSFFLTKKPYRIDYDLKDSRYSIVDNVLPKDDKFESKKKYASPRTLDVGNEISNE